MTKIEPSVVLLGLALWSCSPDDSSPPASASDTTAVVAEWTEARLSATEIDSARYEATWRIAPSIDSLIARDSLARPVDSIVLAEKWEDIGTPSGATTPRPALQLPLGGQVSGPSVLYAQILLDRSPFGPGV
ncbi:MAG TPA: hypothetical protein VLB00_01130, partial [Gemmatimonadales bacterium]|nr:hypothetical protein [Gemmatimonadales bacterium]